SGAAAAGCKFPADYGASRLVAVPIGDPGIHEQPRRIEFENLANGLEYVDSIDGHGGAGLVLEMPAATATRIHLPKLTRAGLAGPPLHQLIRLGERLKHALRRRRDFDFGDDCILIRSDDSLCHLIAPCYSTKKVLSACNSPGQPSL